MGEKNLFRRRKKKKKAEAKVIEAPIQTELDDDVLIMPFEEIKIDLNDPFTPLNFVLVMQDIRYHAITLLHMSFQQTDDLELALTDLDQQIKATDGKKNEYMALDNGISIAITKPIDPNSNDITLSYNKVTMFYGPVSAVWYFDIENGEIVDDYENSVVTNVNSEPHKSGIYFEKSDKNKNTYNNTGYKFWRIDGKELNNKIVNKFIKDMKNEGYEDFQFDFSEHLADDEIAPVYTYIDKNKKEYYIAYDFRIRPDLGDGHNTQSIHLSGSNHLEYAFDGKMDIGPGNADVFYDPFVTQLQNAINYYNAGWGIKPIPVTGTFDNATKQAFIVFQKRYALKDQSGLVGINTLETLDTHLLFREAEDAYQEKINAEIQKQKAEDDAYDQNAKTQRDKLTEELSGTDKKGEKFEMSVGSKVTDTHMHGQTMGYYGMRATSNPDAFLLSKLDGEKRNVTVIGKAEEGGYKWYKIRFDNPAEYKAITADKKKEIEASGSEWVKTIYAANECWVINLAIYGIADYEMFLNQLRAFEAVYSDLTVKERITKLRQMSHTKDFDFDAVIGTEAGDQYLDDRPYVNSHYQLFMDYQGVLLPNGEVVDMYHFIVGLDALQPGRTVEHRAYFSYGIFGSSDIGSSYAAATWSGDIGAAVGDALVKKDSEYEKNEEYEDGSYEQLDHYYNARAQESDLLGDIDAWAGAYHLLTSDPTSIEDIVQKTYGRNIERDSVKTTSANRALGLTLFLKNYGFNTESELSTQTAATELITDQISKFANIWLYNRRTLGPSLADNLLRPIYSKYMMLKFVAWLQKLVDKNQVKIPAK
jgi:peptidoglycan hydrolase-like protein with peptidoglycan-binding domain